MTELVTNSLIIANLQVLYHEAQNSREQKDRFRAKAYANAIKAIKSCNHQLTSGADALKLSGVGKKIADKIQEIINTGKLDQVEEIGDNELEKAKIIELFTKIWGVGPKKANDLWEAGAKSIEDIILNYQHYLNDNQKIGLKYYNDLSMRVPRYQVQELEKIIIDEIKIICTRKKWLVRARVCGSYRRKAENCGDMDVLLCEERGVGILNELVERLKIKGVLFETLGIGPTKYMGITKTSVGTAFRIDMEVIKKHEWPFALLYFTGSGPFNEKQRTIAKKMGYSLSEHGIRDVKTGEYVTGMSSERDIFDFLEMEYLEPWERIG